MTPLYNVLLDFESTCYAQRIDNAVDLHFTNHERNDHTIIILSVEQVEKLIQTLQRRLEASDKELDIAW